MANGRSGYCIDTSAIIDLHRLYPVRLINQLWEDITDLITSGRLVAPNEVYAELKEQDDEAAVWAVQHKRLFVRLTEAQIETARGILRSLVSDGYQRPIDTNKLRSADADIFVVTLARIENLTVIATERVTSGPAERKLSIPDICRIIGVDCLHSVYGLPEFFARENWQYPKT